MKLKAKLFRYPGPGGWHGHVYGETSDSGTRPGQCCACREVDNRAAIVDRSSDALH
jgi:hypothetical protein